MVSMQHVVIYVYDYTEKLNFVKMQSYTTFDCISVNNCGFFRIIHKSVCRTRFFSEGKRLHAVIRLAELVDIHGACDAEVLLARNAEHVAGRDEDVRPLQQRLAELAGRKPGFSTPGNR